MNSKPNGNNDPHSRFKQFGDPCYIKEERTNGSSYTMQFEYAFDEENPSNEAVEVTEYTFNSADTDCRDWFSSLHFDANENEAPADEEDQGHCEMTPLPPNAESHGRYTWTSREIDDDTDLQYNRARHVDPSVGRFLEEEETDDDDDFGSDPPANSEGE